MGRRKDLEERNAALKSTGSICLVICRVGLSAKVNLMGRVNLRQRRIVAVFIQVLWWVVVCTP